MPAFLLSGTFWKFAGIAFMALAVITGAGLFVHHYNYLKSQADLVPALQGQVASLTEQAARDDSRAAKAAIELVAANAARDQAVRDFGQWHDLKSTLDNSIEEMNRHAAASTNPVCLPSAAERKLWNDTLSQLTGLHPGPGPGGADGKVPGGPGGIH